MTPAADTLVVGLGATDRGDDAAGPAVVARVAHTLSTRAGTGARLAPGPRLVSHEDPTALLDLLAAAADRPVGTLVVVDAVRSAAPPGTVVVLDVGPGGADAPSMSGNLEPGPAGTHGFGLAGAIELARALGRLPAHVWVVGVVGQRFDPGAGLSPAVSAALPLASDRVLALLGQGTTPPGAAPPSASAGRP